MNNLQNYIGVKLLTARPMTRGEYNKYCDLPPPEEKDYNEAGYLVIYQDSYESWSPKPQFDEAYRLVEGGHMSFGLAIEAMKKGMKVAREGWNGKDMYLQYEKAKDFEYSEMLPFIIIKTVQNTFVPWLASQTDILSDDWFAVE